MTIELSDLEFWIAREVGRLRREKCQKEVKKGERADFKRVGVSDLLNQQIAVCGELASARGLNVFPSFLTNLFEPGDDDVRLIDGFRIDVKTRVFDPNRKDLFVYPHHLKKGIDAFLLANAFTSSSSSELTLHRRIELVGWIDVKTIQARGYETRNAHGRTILIPRGDLFDVEELRAY